MSFWSWVGENSNQIGILTATLPVVWAAVQYLASKRTELKHRQFETYHSLIKALVQREDKDQPMMLDRQIAIVFELRNFKDYFPVSLRILRGLKETWADYGPEEKRRRLHEELDLSIRHISKKVGGKI